MTAFIALALLRLALVAGIPMIFLPYQLLDDDLFVRLAQTVERGNWLGHYSQYVLAKGPGLSLSIAAMRLIGIPYEFGMQVLWCSACVLLFIAFSRLARTKIQFWILFLTAAAVLFHPSSYASFNLRVLRESPLYIIQTVAIFAGALLAICAIDDRGRLRWAIFTGFLVGWFWITREEGPWLLPSLLIFLAWMFLATCRQRRNNGPTPSTWKHSVVLIAAPIAAACLVNYAVCTANYLRYRLFCVVEFKVPAFVDAYAALARIDPAHRIRRVPVSAAARQMAYSVSPTFRKLQPLLDGPAGQGWATFSASYVPAGHDEIGGGHFMWALRDAVFDTWHPKNAAQAMSRYRQITKEINAGIAAGKIPAGPVRNTMVPPIARSDLPLLIATARRGWMDLIDADALSMELPPSAQGQDTPLFADMLLTSPTLTEPGIRVHIDGWAFDARDRDVTVRLSAHGDSVPEIIQWQASPDLAVMPSTKGIAHAKIARFHIDGLAEPDSLLSFSVGAKEADLDYQHKQRVIKGPPIYAAIDSVSFSDEFGPIDRPGHQTLAHHLLNIRGRILICYQKIQPILCIVASLAFLVMVAAAFRLSTARPFLWLALATLAAICMRVALLAYIDTLSFPAISGEYLSAAYPLVPIFIGATVCGALSWRSQPNEPVSIAAPPSADLC